MSGRAVFTLCLFVFIFGIVFGRVVLDIIFDWLAEATAFAYEWLRGIIMVVGVIALVLLLVWVWTGDAPSLPADPGPSA